MPKTTQETRLLELMTPLGKDVLLIRSIHGREALSQLYSYEIEAFAPITTEVDFAKMIGQAASVRVTLKNMDQRFFHGIIKSVCRGARSFSAVSYRIEIVPSLWLLSQRTQSRIFQQITVPDILKKVLIGFDVDYEFSGTFEPRDYCVQYRETDFAFASRLMEEEGIFYYFRHEEENHTMVVANSPQTHQEIPFDHTLCFDEERGGFETTDEIVYSWEKQQALRPGKVTLWDHSFELPHKSLDAQELVDEELQIGEVAHKLKVGGNDTLEFYDYPGGYAQRFDGMTPTGGDRPDDLQKIYTDNQRTARIRMHQETIGAIQIHALTDYLNIPPGFLFDFARHYSDNDQYVITSASVAIPQQGSYHGEDTNLDTPPPEISFNCTPLKLPFVPARVTPKPVIYGTQTALVVGPAGEEIFTDKYGRVKVQFFWDREGKFDANSSCWVRVASPWAGKHWGMVHIPRIGQEVVVAFEEGDPDQPIIVGSVYNADQMPPHELPANKTQSGVKSRSTPGAGSGNLNEIRFEDKIGQEHIFIHGEKDIHVRCKASYFESIGADYNQSVGGDSRTGIAGKKSLEVKGSMAVRVHGEIDERSLAGRNMVDNTCINIKSADLRLKGDTTNLIGTAAIKITSTGGIEINADAGLYLKCGGSSITLTPGSAHITAGMVHINSASASGSAPDVTPPAGVGPDAPAAALLPGETQATENRAGSGAGSENSHDENAEENKDKTHWIEVELKDESGAPVQGESCEITLPDGKKAVRSTDKKGLIRVEKIDAGNCNIRWLNLDQDAISQ